MSLDHNAPLREADPTVARLIDQELRRQQHGLELIASENFASRAVIDAMGTPLTNKYAEGYPGRRYYGGCEVVDQIEQLAIDRLKELFGADHANVQPHSGAQANFAAFMALIKPGETIMGMSLPHGGHLSHGAAVNHSGVVWRAVHYGVDPATGRIDHDVVREQAKREQPKLIIAGGSAYARVIDFAAFRSIADEVGAFFLVDMAHFAGLVAGGVHPSPVPHAQVVTSTTHKTLRGPRSGLILSNAEQAKAIDKSVFPGSQGGPLEHVIAAKAVAFGEALTSDFRAYARRVVENAKTLDQAGITVNKNTIPDDPQSPFVTSGVRIGTPAITTRGMGTAEMVRVAELIDRALTQPDEATLSRVKAEVEELTSTFPLYAPARSVPGRARRPARAPE